MSQYRIEHDSMGEVRLPAAAYYGAQTQRAVENFPISGRTLPPELIHAFGLVKWAAAIANRDLGKLTGSGKNPLTQAQVDALIAACREVADGRFDDQFPVDVFQTGSGTSSNMNANEVIANRAIELGGGDRFAAQKPIHPNDHVNLGQSTNDVFPTAIHVAVALAIHEQLLPALRDCGRVLAEKAAEWKDILKIGRTHLIDATPLVAGPGVRRLGAAIGPLGRPSRAGAGCGAGIAHRRHGRGQRHQHPSASSPAASARRLAEATGIALRRGGRSFRGQRPARRAGRVPRPVAHHRRHAVQRGQQHPLARLRAAMRHPRNHPARPASRAVRSCRARSTR